MAKGTKGLRTEAAAAKHAHAFTNHWIPWDINHAMTTDDWSYRLFPWELIIARPKVYKTIAAVDPETGSLEGLLSTQVVNPRLFKVAFVATAPWNYHQVAARQRVGVGPALLSCAINQSRRAKCGGALTLSSTNAAEAFYDACGFVRTGERDPEGLVIFTLSSDHAIDFQRKYPSIPVAA